MEAKLGSLRLLPEAGEGDGFLVALLADVGGRFVSERRKDVLFRAREVVLADYHNTMLANGDAQDDEPASAGDVGDTKTLLEKSATMQALRFDSCQVSLASCRILRLAHEVMRQAVASSPDLALTLYHSARDCIELFLAIVPVKFAHIIGSVPRMGAVFFNDCAYMAHNCTLLSHAYRADLGKASPALAEACGFVDFIPRLRAAGEEVLAAHLHEQARTMQALVARIRLSPDCEQGDEGPTNQEEGASMAVAHMGKLNAQWRHVLQVQTSCLVC